MVLPEILPFTSISQCIKGILLTSQLPSSNLQGFQPVASQLIHCYCFYYSFLTPFWSTFHIILREQIMFLFLSVKFWKTIQIATKMIFSLCVNSVKNLFNMCVIFSEKLISSRYSRRRIKTLLGKSKLIFYILIISSC